MIWDYYHGKTLFITGATGFVGCALLCRLLSQTSPKQVYVLCRGGYERAKARWSEQLPASLAAALIESDCLTVVDGDMTDDEMELSEKDLLLLHGLVNIVIHAASRYSLRNSLWELSYPMIAPSLSLLELALKFPHVQRFVFVSSAYADAHLWMASDSSDVPVEERIYPLSPEGEEDLRQATREAWRDVQKTGTSREYESHDFPWPYAYAKHLAERLIMYKAAEYNVSEKVLIVRPSVIGPADKFPYPGFCTGLSAPSTAIAASYILHPGRRIALASCCQNPNQEATVDEVPVDVVVDRLLVHVALATAGCVHAVCGEDRRLSLQDWWHAYKKERLLPWNAKPVWTSQSWHSSDLHPMARNFKIIGTSFAFKEDKTLQIFEELDESDRGNLKLFADRFSPYSLASRRHQHPTPGRTDGQGETVARMFGEAIVSERQATHARGTVGPGEISRMNTSLLFRVTYFEFVETDVQLV